MGLDVESATILREYAARRFEDNVSLAARNLLRHHRTCRRGVPGGSRPRGALRVITACLDSEAASILEHTAFWEYDMNLSGAARAFFKRHRTCF